MNGLKRIPILIIVFLCPIFISVSAQDKMEFNARGLIGIWVLKNKTAHLSTYARDTLECIPISSHFAEHLDKSTGMEFNSDGYFVQHFPVRCSMGDPPDKMDGSWMVTKETDRLTLIIRFNNGILKEYEIYSWNKDNLILIKK